MKVYWGDSGRRCLMVERPYWGKKENMDQRSLTLLLLRIVDRSWRIFTEIC